VKPENPFRTPPNKEEGRDAEEEESRLSAAQAKPIGLARDRINGKEHYLGQYGSAESRERCYDLIAEWLGRNGDVTRYTFTIEDLYILCMHHAERYY
jgi:hypothetical protein